MYFIFYITRGFTCLDIIMIIIIVIYVDLLKYSTIHICISSLKGSKLLLFASWHH